MLIGTLETARLLEDAHAAHLEAQVRAYAKLHPEAACRAERVGGGVAALTRRSFGRKLNHVTGFGMHGPVTHRDAARLEALYHPLGLPVEVDVCPVADPSVPAVLGARAYRVSAFSSTYAHVLAAGEDHDLPRPRGVTVRPVRAGDEEAFVASSVESFAAQPNPRPRELLEALARIALVRSDSRAYLALVDGHVAGTAAMALVATTAGSIAHLYIASTTPAFRGRGVQGALLRARLAEATRSGAILASVTARAASASARNAERAGFRLAYSTVTLSRHPDPVRPGEDAAGDGVPVSCSHDVSHS